jgi:Mg/Co/Ni transporter MgtE
MATTVLEVHKRMKKEVFTGVIVGFICNAIGILITTFIVSKARNLGLEDTFKLYYNTNNLWMLITLGALPNLLAFFGFLRINREHRARGVLLATFVAAISSYLIYFL